MVINKNLVFCECPQSKYYLTNNSINVLAIISNILELQVAASIPWVITLTHMSF